MGLASRAAAGGAAATPMAGEPVDSAALLADLEDAHARLLLAMAALDRLTRLPLPDRNRLLEARLELSAASHERRILWKKCFEFLRPVADAATAQRLDAANDEHFELLRRSAGHVARWRAGDVESEWQLYCQASREFRSRLAASIDLDRELLLPLLQP